MVKWFQSDPNLRISLAMWIRTMAYYNNRPGHHTWNVSSVTYWNPIDMVFSEQVYIIKWWSKNQVSENSVEYSWNYEALSVSLKCPINHEIKKFKISCFGNTKILTLTCFDPNMKKLKRRNRGKNKKLWFLWNHDLWDV